MHSPEHYYKILDLQYGVSADVLKQAYRDLVKVWHPDRFAKDSQLQEKAQGKLKEINGAYEFLKIFQPERIKESSETPEQPLHNNHKTSQNSKEYSQPFSANPQPSWHNIKDLETLFSIALSEYNKGRYDSAIKVLTRMLDIYCNLVRI